MELIILNAVERKRFSDYCRQEAETEKGLLAQATKLGAGGLLMAQRLLPRMAAYAFVAADLVSWEEYKL